jgi:UDP-N-acetylglucosamine 2-epimerase
MKILSVVGARPEFIQAAPIYRALQRSVVHQEIRVHTGQHYDYRMSQTILEELGIPAPAYNLEVGSGRPGWQTATILARMEEVLLAENPELVIVRGDTNSTLAGALAAAKLHIPLAHVEAGERSYDRSMPEEINRCAVDSISDLHFCASQAAVKRLAAEGYASSVHWVGDVMLDAMHQHLPIARRNSDILTSVYLQSRRYALVTIHRAANTDSPVRMAQIIDALNQVEETIIFPVHPRTRKALTQFAIPLAEHIHLIEPVGYFDMLVLEENARLIATDSGGVQREAYSLGIPCLTLRDETEWMETVHAGWNQLVGADSATIVNAWFTAQKPPKHPPLFGDGTAASRIVQIIENSYQPNRQHGLSSGHNQLAMQSTDLGVRL